MSRHRPGRATVAAASAAGLLAAAAVAAVAGSPPTSAQAPRFDATGPLVFSHEVPVDEQRPGFEPDIHVGPGDRLYTTMPAGSLLTRSYIYYSRDHGNSYHFVPDAVADKPGTCAGGGDTELALDAKGNLFFSDLQNLTNLSNSVSTDGGHTFTTTCLGADNTPVDRMWYALHGTLGSPGFVLYEDYDAVISGVTSTPTLNNPLPVSNQLVEEYSTDGLTFSPVVNADPAGSGCLGAAAYNCVTSNEGISGNQVIAPNGDLLIAHTTSDGNQVVVSRGVLTRVGPVLEARWHNTVVDASLCPDTATRPGTCGATTFATIAEDSAGHFYTVFASQPQVNTPNGAVATGPYEVYVVSSADGVHWSSPVQVSHGGSNAFPWITAGSSGRVAIAWYHANEVGEGKGNYTFDSLRHAEFSVQVGESLDALAARPHYAISTVTEHPIKYGPICTQGLGCTISGGDRSLGDFLQLTTDARGALVVSYVDDTSQAYVPGPTPGSQVANAGPIGISRQIGGPSLFAQVGTVRGAAGGPGLAMGSVSDPYGDFFYTGETQKLPAGPGLTLTGAAVSRAADGGLTVTLRARSLSSLAVPAPIPGDTALWILRWTDYTPGQVGNGHIYYAGMQSVAGGAPTFFTGDVAPMPASQNMFMEFPVDHTVPGSYDARTGVITIHVPAADVGSPGTGSVLYSAVGFTASSPGPLSAVTLFNQLGATPPFDVVLGAPGRPDRG